MKSRYSAVSLLEAAEASPTLAGLAARARDSADRLAAVLDLVPPDMRATLQAGPAEGDTWCLLVNGSAAAAKLRQLTPLLKVRLRNKGWEVSNIRIKVRARH
jgi:hypothetical protein